MGHIPYGYRMENGKATVDEDAVKRLLKLYEGYLSGLSLDDAARQAGIEKRHSQVKKTLLNRKYLGTQYYPQVISEEMYEKAEHEIQRRAAALGRIFEPKPKQEPTVAVTFMLGKIETKYANPYRQAEYAYSLIEEVRTDGEGDNDSCKDQEVCSDR